MIKQMAWNTFKNTGNIDTFLEFKQVKEIEKDIENEVKKELNVEENVDGNDQNKWNYNSGKQFKRL